MFATSVTQEERQAIYQTFLSHFLAPKIDLKGRFDRKDAPMFRVRQKNAPRVQRRRSVQQ